MEKQTTTLSELTLVGLTARTNNKNEMNPEKSKIANLAGYYWGNQIGNKIQNRIQPGITYSVYTNFESDENGDYTYFVGEAVNSTEGQDFDTFESLIIPASNYTQFTTQSGKMPDIIISAWQEIWSMGKSDFNGERSYIADFEVYDEKASDPNNAVVDIFIGIKDL